MGIGILISGILLLVLTLSLLRRKKPIRFLGLLLILPTLALLIAGAYWTWFTHRRQPPITQEQWFPGITYQRLILQQPRPIIIHLVRVDLRDPAISLVFTPLSSTGNRPLNAATVSTFLRQSGAQVAINANYYYPFSAQSPLSYYPHEGDPVQVAGIAAYRGTLYQPHPFDPPADPAATMYVSKEGHITFSAPEGEIYNAISGNAFLIRQGHNIAQPDPVEPLSARTAIGLDVPGNTLFLAVIDGKQPHYSEGATPPEFATILITCGVHTAIALDGGGSSELARQSPDGTPVLVNSLSNFRIPRWERPIANHLGISTKAP